MRNRSIALCCVLALGAADQAGAQAARHICRLLNAEEVKTLLGPTVALANVTEDEPERSTCQYEDKDGAPVFILTVYWTGGKQQWNASGAARGAGDKMLAGAEGVGIDSLARAGMVKAGPVQGLGEAAYFSDLLPSQVLKGDILLELNMSLLQDPEAKFRPLAEALLKRL
jgi:hypothetical protein